MLWRTPWFALDGIVPNKRRHGAAGACWTEERRRLALAGGWRRRDASLAAEVASGTRAIAGGAVSACTAVPTRWTWVRVGRCAATRAVRSRHTRAAAVLIRLPCTAVSTRSTLARACHAAQAEHAAVGTRWTRGGEPIPAAVVTRRALFTPGSPCRVAVDRCAEVPDAHATRRGAAGGTVQRHAAAVPWRLCCAARRTICGRPHKPQSHTARHTCRVSTLPWGGVKLHLENVQ